MENKIMIHFEALEDPRQQGKVLHPMRNIVFIVLVGALNGLDGWEEIADFAEYRRDFLEKYLDLSNGIPTDDTLRRFFQNLNPKSFQERFVSWTSSIVHDVDGKVVSIDGKRIRKASEMNDRNPIHIVSAWLSENEMTLGQLKVSEKTNEITAISQLIEILDLKGATVTIESMHWQLDVVFGEDSSLKRIKNSAENFNIVWKIVLGLLNNDGIDYGKKRVSLKRRMLHAIHDDGYLENLLQRL